MARAWPVGWESCVGALWLRSRLGRTEDHGHLPYVPGQSFQEPEDSEFESGLQALMEVSFVRTET